ncbi:hypothetical protein D3C81_2054410 [compost metagenome]
MVMATRRITVMAMMLVMLRVSTTFIRTRPRSNCRQEPNRLISRFTLKVSVLAAGWVTPSTARGPAKGALVLLHGSDRCQPWS